MAGHAELKVDGEVHLVDVAELDEDVRRARVPPHALLHYPPWTGETWRRVDEIAALADAVDAPEARFAAHLRAPPRAGLTALFVLGFALAAAAQFHARAALAADGGALLRRLSLGWEPTLVDGAWWSPFTAPLLHESFVHLLGNLVIFAYCSWRVERAIGGAGLAGVLGGALFGASIGILGFSALPCIGASVLAFGVWGGQFAIGWRHADVIPVALRRYYGAGTILVALPLLAWTFLNPGVSFAGHLGGFVGGAVAVGLLPLTTHVPRSRRWQANARALAVAAALAAVPSALSIVAPWFPQALAIPGEEVADPESGLAVRLPWRWADGLRASTAPLDVLLPAPSPAAALHVARVVEGADRHGDFRVRGAAEHLGTILEVGWSDEVALAPARAALYASIATTPHWTPPPELGLARARHEAAPDDPALAFAYAQSLEASGADADALAAYATLDNADDAWSLRAARARMRLCAIDPTFPTCDAAWRDRWLDRAPPGEHSLWLDGVHWSSLDGARCAEVEARLGSMRATGEFNEVELGFARGPCPGV